MTQILHRTGSIHPLPRARRIRGAATAALAVLALTACGGGGSDGDAAVLAPVPLNAGNQDAVARASVIAVLGIFYSGPDPMAHGGSSMLAAPRKGALWVPTALPAMAPALAHGRDALRLPLSAIVPASGKVRVAAVTSDEVNCAVSGSAEYSLNDADNSGVRSAGDSVRVTYNNCVEFEGETVNGSVGATYTRTQTSPTVSFDASLRYSGLTLTLVDGVVTFNGIVSLAYSEPTPDSSVSTLTVVSEPLTVSASRTVEPRYSDAITLQAGFRATSTSTFSLLAQTAGTVTGAVRSVSAGGTVTLSTVVPVVQRDVDLYPISGQVVAEGAVGRVRTTVLNTTNVRVELDANGDGSYEGSKEVPWAELL